VIADIGLLEQDGAAFVELAEEAEAEVDVGGEVSIDTGEALLGAIDPDLAGDAAQDVGFEVGGIEVWVGREAQPVALARAAGDDAFDAIEEGLGEQRHEVVDAGGVALLAPVAVLLEIGMGGEGVEAGELGAVSVGGERLAVDGDQASDVAVLGLEDLLGGVAGDAVALLGFVQEVAEGAMGGVGFGAVGEGATDEGGGIDGSVLRGGRRRGQERNKKEGREAVHADKDTAGWGERSHLREDGAAVVLGRRKKCSLATLDAHPCDTTA
jgi:hypothetical protein